jgi:DNA-binding LytR/AlgR family response regulator
MKILIVEDEAIIAESLFQLLTLLDYETMEPVDDVDLAIEKIKRDEPDLILLDMTLKQGRSSVEILSFLQAEKLNIPFIVITAHSDINVINAVRKYKPAAFLVKPFMRESLFAAIELALPFDEEETQEDCDELFLKTGTKYERLDLREAIYLRANGKYTEIHFGFGKRLIRISLSSFVAENTHISFIRVHKTYAVNAAYITNFKSDELMMPNNVHIPVGRFFLPAVQCFIKKHSFLKK